MRLRAVLYSLSRQFGRALVGRGAAGDTSPAEEPPDSWFVPREPDPSLDDDLSPVPIMTTPLPATTLGAIDAAFEEGRRKVIVAASQIEAERVGLQSVFDSAANLIAGKGYVIHNGDAEIGEVFVGGPHWWFTFTQGGDVEAGETWTSVYGATQDALNHWFSSSFLDVDLGAEVTAPAPLTAAAPDLVRMVLEDLDTCVAELGPDYAFKELSEETVVALRAVPRL